MNVNTEINRVVGMLRTREKLNALSMMKKLEIRHYEDYQTRM